MISYPLKMKPIIILLIRCIKCYFSLYLSFLPNIFLLSFCQVKALQKKVGPVVPIGSADVRVEGAWRKTANKTIQSKSSAQHPA